MHSEQKCYSDTPLVRAAPSRTDGADQGEAKRNCLGPASPATRCGLRGGRKPPGGAGTPAAHTLCKLGDPPGETRRNGAHAAAAC